MRRANLKFFAVFLLVGCSEAENKKLPTPSETYRRTCITVEPYAERLSAELTKQNIDHLYDRETNCIRYPETYCEEVELADVKVGGEPPPPGLSTNWEGRNDELVELLESNGVATTKYNRYGMEWISWSSEDYQLAEDLMDAEPWLRNFYRENRESKKPPNKCGQQGRADSAPLP